MRVYRYWAEPLQDDLPALREQLKLAAAYARVLAEIENRARVLVRAKVKSEVFFKEQASARRWAYAQARKAGLGWGTCLKIAEAVEHSRRTTGLQQDLRTHYPHGEGLVAVQIQATKPLSSEDLVGGQDTRARIGADLVARREGGARRLQVISLRVSSTEDRQPVWVRLHALLHRPLGSGQVKWVLVTASRCGPKLRWSLQVTVDEATSASPNAVTVTRGACGLDIGWRRMPDRGIRIAYWYGSDGAEGELRIPADVIARNSKADDLRSIRDRNRADVQLRLHMLRDSKGVPDWYREATTTLHVWKRTGYFVRLVDVWRNRRWSGDEDAWHAVEAWLHHDRHLWAWEANNRRRQSLQVAGRVRQFAVELARRYGVISVERTGIVPSLVRRREGASGEEQALRRVAAMRMHGCSPALVRRELAWIAPKYGATLIEQNPAFTTQDCAECDHRRMEVEDWSSLDITCAACGVVEDQDRTAARNLLRLASAPVPTKAGEPLASSVKKQKLSVRRTRKRVVSSPLANDAASVEDHG